MSIALSSAESEYIAGMHAAKEAIWLHQLFTEIRFPDFEPTVIHMDNQSVMTIAKNPQFHECTKHINMKYHFLHNKVEEEEIQLKYIPTGHQVANVFTKGLSHEKHVQFTKEMGLGHLA